MSFLDKLLKDAYYILPKNIDDSLFVTQCVFTTSYSQRFEAPNRLTLIELAWETVVTGYQQCVGDGPESATSGSGRELAF